MLKIIYHLVMCTLKTQFHHILRTISEDKNTDGHTDNSVSVFDIPTLC